MAPLNIIDLEEFVWGVGRVASVELRKTVQFADGMVYLHKK